MKATRLVILTLALGLPTATLLAQNDGPPPGPPPGEQNDGPPGGGGQGGRHRLPPMPLIAALDANHDGVLSADEIANAPAALKTLDKNADGQLTKDEYLPARPPHGTNSTDHAGQGKQDGPPPDGAPDKGRPHRPVPPIVAALDTNGDGIISADEIANAAASLLKLDKNGDGKLTMDELMGPRPKRGGGDGGLGPDGGGNGQRPPPPGDDKN